MLGKSIKSRFFGLLAKVGIRLRGKRKRPIRYVGACNGDELSQAKFLLEAGYIEAATDYAKRAVLKSTARLAISFPMYPGGHRKGKSKLNKCVGFLYETGVFTDNDLAEYREFAELLAHRRQLPAIPAVRAIIAKAERLVQMVGEVRRRITPDRHKMYVEILPVVVDGGEVGENDLLALRRVAVLTLQSVYVNRYGQDLSVALSGWNGWTLNQLRGEQQLNDDHHKAIRKLLSRRPSVSLEGFETAREAVRELAGKVGAA